MNHRLWARWASSETSSFVWRDNFLHLYITIYGGERRGHSAPQGKKTFLINQDGFSCGSHDGHFTRLTASLCLNSAALSLGMAKKRCFVSMAQQTDGCRGDLRLESLARSRHIGSEPVADVIPSNAKESRWRRDFLRRTTEYVSPLDRMRPPTV